MLLVFFPLFFAQNFLSVLCSRTLYLPYLRNGWSNSCETKRKWVNWMLCWLWYLWPWPLILTFDYDFKCQVVPQKWVAQLSWKEKDGSRKDALMRNTKEMSQQDTVLTGVLLTFAFDLEFSRSNCILGMGGPIVMEWKGWESIGCPDVKDNHYVTSRQRKLLGTGVT